MRCQTNGSPGVSSLHAFAVRPIACLAGSELRSNAPVVIFYPYLQHGEQMKSRVAYPGILYLVSATTAPASRR